MELTIRRSLDGEFIIDCGDEHRCFSMWLERELNKDRQFVLRLLAQLEQLSGLDELCLDSAEFRFVASCDEVSIEVSTDESSEHPGLLEEALSLDAAHSACGYDDFIELLKSIIKY
ncbi:YacL family protein [Agarivorans sp. 1_MG-2023]|uniref:YacL family protein n=1 Tax=unclassified Agarivorans TaxID=2636026 RepID=UPI0026E16292|nr:YacL family protein [Agarivorans sp. 1_MG-2023]MDO6764526.1 YacL family protein [Agarivorans sp. 1_MG-2023]